MPEGYTHASIALKAAAAADWKLSSREAFLAGANGPDILFSFEAWKPADRRRMNLSALGERMHAERTGAFLKALQSHAVTAAQNDYFLGFLCHYAVDTVVHPYVETVTRSCAPYGGRAGHAYFEAALDSFLYKKETGHAAVPVNAFNPRLRGTPLAEVNAQLQLAILDTYGIDIPREYLADAFDNSTMIRGLFCAKTPLRFGLFYLVEPLFGGRGKLTGHVTPARLRGISHKDARKGISLPTVWHDPATGLVREENLYQVLEKAEKYCTDLVREAVAPYTGYDLFWPLVGSKDYTLGTETALSAAGAAEQTPLPQGEQPSAEAAVLLPTRGRVTIGALKQLMPQQAAQPAAAPAEEAAPEAADEAAAEPESAAPQPAAEPAPAEPAQASPAPEAAPAAESTPQPAPAAPQPAAEPIPAEPTPASQAVIDLFTGPFADTPAAGDPVPPPAAETPPTAEAQPE